MTQITPLYGRLDETEIAALEKRLNLKLPAAYREFLRQNNGGRTEANVFTVPGGWGTSVVNRFFGVQKGATYDLERDRELMEGRYPSKALAIAEDPAGNRILIGTAGKTLGKIYLWDHENEPPDDECTENVDDYSNIHRVADSLDDFLKSLREDGKS